MGIGPAVLALYRQMKATGAFDGVTNVCELGSQGVWCPDKRLLEGLYRDFGRPMPPEDELSVYINSDGTGRAASRHLHETLGFDYECIDIDKEFGAIALDLNWDCAPQNWRNHFELVTNHGTLEHLLNQQNAFQVIHDITKVSGLMLHVVPFTHIGHGFFNYQPSLFNGIARFNSYEMLGLWVGIDWQLTSFVPWQPKLMEFLKLDEKSTHHLVVLMRKRYDQPFQPPIQDIYENMLPATAAERYNFVVDGELLSGRRVLHVTARDIELPPPPEPMAPPEPMPPPEPIRIVERAPLTDYPVRQLAEHVLYRVARRVGFVK